jgi:hypothetical protein
MYVVRLLNTCTTFDTEAAADAYCMLLRRSRAGMAWVERR